jgi:hypothetical protein
MTSAWKIIAHLPRVIPNNLEYLAAVIAYVQYFSAEVARNIDARCAPETPSNGKPAPDSPTFGMTLCLSPDSREPDE